MWIARYWDDLLYAPSVRPLGLAGGLRVYVGSDLFKVSHPSSARSTSRARALTPTVGGRREYELPRPPLVIDQWTEPALLDDFGSRRGGAAARLQNDDE